MQNTMKTINEIANERQALWSLAGKRYLLKDEFARLQEISAELPRLWDQHRREVAGDINPVLPSRYPRRELIREEEAV